MNPTHESISVVCRLALYQSITPSMRIRYGLYFRGPTSKAPTVELSVPWKCNDAADLGNYVSDLQRGRST